MAATCLSGSGPLTHTPALPPWAPSAGDEVDEAAVANVVLGQFEKVQRSKSKWKIVLKVGGGATLQATCGLSKPTAVGS